jgi:hypothetical protein
MSTDDAPAMSAAKDAPVEEQPAVDINPINMATIRLGDIADTCHSSPSNTKGKHPEYPGHN